MFPQDAPHGIGVVTMVEDTDYRTLTVTWDDGIETVNYFMGLNGGYDLALYLPHCLTTTAAQPITTGKGWCYCQHKPSLYYNVVCGGFTIG